MRIGNYKHYLQYMKELKRIKSALKNPVDVVKSNIKRAVSKEDQSWKLDICDHCEHKEEDKVFGGFMCGECLCPLESLIHSDKGCPIKLW